MKKLIIKIIAGIIAIFFLITIIIGILNYAFFEKQVSSQLAAYGIAGLFFITVILEFFPQYITAHVGIVSAALFNINPIQTLLTILSGSILGSLIGFEVGRIYGQEFVKDLIGNKKFKKAEIGINKRGKWIVSLAAISPIPYVPMIIGVLKMSRRKFILWGILPRSIGYIIATILVYFVL